MKQVAPIDADERDERQCQEGIEELFREIDIDLAIA
jgi:hypothetical protein